MLLIQGARSALRAGKVSDEPDDLRAGALDVERRRGYNVVAVALANKLARVAWRVWRDQRPFETCLVSTNGGIRWYGDRVPVGRLFAGHDVGLEEIDPGLFEVYFGPIWLGRFVELKRLTFDSLGRGQRRTGGTCKGRRTVTQVS